MNGVRGAILIATFVVASVTACTRAAYPRPDDCYSGHRVGQVQTSAQPPVWSRGRRTATDTSSTAFVTIYVFDVASGHALPYASLDFTPVSGFRRDLMTDTSGFAHLEVAAGMYAVRAQKVLMATYGASVAVEPSSRDTLRLGMARFGACAM